MKMASQLLLIFVLFVVNLFPVFVTEMWRGTDLYVPRLPLIGRGCPVRSGYATLDATDIVIVADLDCLRIAIIRLKPLTELNDGDDPANLTAHSIHTTKFFKESL